MLQNILKHLFIIRLLVITKVRERERGEGGDKDRVCVTALLTTIIFITSIITVLKTITLIR